MTLYVLHAVINKYMFLAKQKKNQLVEFKGNNLLQPFFLQCIKIITA